MIAGSSGCPDTEYTTNEITDARAGILIVTALFADRINNSERKYL
jgi:hypothetical protein